MRVLIKFLLGQFLRGLFFSKSQKCGKIDIPKLLYFFLPSLQIRIINGCEPSASVFDLNNNILTVAFM